ncbi:MAG TPA: hypothetical protein VKB23_02550 [Solirubrobacterales bacterium]|nr:hypothetical protein [Solirubrobacterales bacterium]
MNKKAMLLALAAISVGLMALPAIAGATTAHLSGTSTFTISGGTGQLVTTSGSTIHCTSTAGSGNFTTTTSGTVDLTFHGCKDKTFGFNCTTAGQPAGTIVPPQANVDLIMVTHNGSTKPAVLIKPKTTQSLTTTRADGQKALLFASFTCFGVTTEVFGNGIIGTITHPACGTSSTTAGLEFQQASNGHQTHTTSTGVSYYLESKLGGGAHEKASITSSATITFPAARTLTCT